MARPTEYKLSNVLEQAMQTFLNYGYTGSSISMLVKSTGLNTRTMYNLFGNKEGLYEAVLKNYFEEILSKPLELLQQSKGLWSIQVFFSETIKELSPQGCLYVKALAEHSDHDFAPFQSVLNYYQELELTFKLKLYEASVHRKFREDVDQTSKELVLLNQGLSLFLSCQPDLTDCEGFIRNTLKKLSIK